MSIVKRAVVLLAAVCMLAGSPAMTASAACGDNHGKKLKTVWTGQYRYSSYTHTVIVGYYTNGNPITMSCHVNVTKKICLCYCTECDEYVTTADLPYKEAHSIVHD